MNTSENTTTPETEDTETTASTQKTGFLKKTCEKIRSIHPAWIVSLILALILITILSHTYFDRGSYRNQRMFEGYHQSMIPVWHDMDRFERDFQREFDRMDQEMESMRTRHRAMMESLETLPVETTATSGKYSGTRVINGETMVYSLATNSGLITGNITFSNTGKLSTLKNQIEKLGYTLQAQNNSLSLSGSTRNMNTLLQILQ